jgi:hypothetical protein
MNNIERIRHLKLEIDSEKEYSEALAKELSQLQDALGCPCEMDGNATDSAMCRIRDLIAAEGELGDLKEKKPTLRESDNVNLANMLSSAEKRTAQLTDLLTSARAIAERKGEDTAWVRFAARIEEAGIGKVTPRTFRILPSDICSS